MRRAIFTNEEQLIEACTRWAVDTNAFFLKPEIVGASLAHALIRHLDAIHDADPTAIARGLES